MLRADIEDREEREEGGYQERFEKNKNTKEVCDVRSLLFLILSTLIIIFKYLVYIIQSSQQAILKKKIFFYFFLGGRLYERTLVRILRRKW